MPTIPSRSQVVVRVIGLLFTGAGAIGIAAAHCWVGPKVGRAATRVHAGITKTRALLLEWKAYLAGLEPVLAQAEDAAAHGPALASDAAEALGSLEESHRGLAHALEVASQDFARTPAAPLFRKASGALTQSADRVSRLASSVRAQQERVAALVGRLPEVRKALVQAHSTADTLANRTSKALALFERTHVYRLFLVVADGVSLVLVGLGLGLFVLAGPVPRRVLGA